MSASAPGVPQPVPPRVSPDIGARALVILGAPRSGTNMLRDALCALPGFATWPCDEINAVWRSGNVGEPTDALSPELARPDVVRRVRASFAWVAQRTHCSVVVEKTCANCLRPAFVDRCVPEALYVQIVRDPRDAVPSAALRWNAGLEPRYLLAKARFMPPADAPHYAAAVFQRLLRRATGGSTGTGAWGPKLRDHAARAATCTPDQYAALQWAACVDEVDAFLRAAPPKRSRSVRYEDFVADPATALRALSEFAGASATDAALTRAVGTVRSGSVGKGRRALAVSTLRAIDEACADGMTRHGYA